jgi:hypothetical protein
VGRAICPQPAFSRATGGAGLNNLRLAGMLWGTFNEDFGTSGRVENKGFDCKPQASPLVGRAICPQPAFSRATGGAGLNNLRLAGMLWGTFNEDFGTSGRVENKGFDCKP